MKSIGFCERNTLLWIVRVGFWKTFVMKCMVTQMQSNRFFIRNPEYHLVFKHWVLVDFKKNNNCFLLISQKLLHFKQNYRISREVSHCDHRYHVGTKFRTKLGTFSFFTFTNVHVHSQRFRIVKIKIRITSSFRQKTVRAYWSKRRVETKVFFQNHPNSLRAYQYMV